MFVTHSARFAEIEIPGVCCGKETQWETRFVGFEFEVLSNLLDTQLMILRWGQKEGSRKKSNSPFPSFSTLLYFHPLFLLPSSPSPAAPSVTPPLPPQPTQAGATNSTDSRDSLSLKMSLFPP